MSGITWKIYREKTGNPAIDNRARNANRQLSKMANTNLKFTAQNRKRRKILKRIEGGYYVVLVARVSQQLALK